MRGGKTKKKAEADAVADVQERTQQAAALAGISGQELLGDPRLNPATRGHADRLRDEQQIKALDAQNARLLRRDRVADARASEAERTLEAIALAQRASSPARSVMALHNGRRMWSRLAIAASVVLAAGSAMGVEAAAQHLKAPEGTGYVAEVGLTGLATAAITYRAHLAEHRGELKAGSWQSRSLWALMIVPLLVSVTANLATGNALGAMCAIGAAAFALLGAVVADRSAAAMQARADEVDDADEAKLRAVAMGEDLPAAPAPLVALDAEGRPEITWSREPEITESRDSATTPDHIVEPSAEDAGGHIDSQQRADVAVGEDLEDPEAVLETQCIAMADDAGWSKDRIAQRLGITQDAVSEALDRANAAPVVEPDMARVLAAAEARRAAGAQTRARVADFLTRHPDATIPQIADGLQLSEATAKRHRRALRGANGVEL